MAKVIGIGGVFVKSKNPDALRGWYREHLGIDVSEWGAQFEQQKAPITWNPFAESTKYFDPSTREVMINFVVDDLESMLAKLRAAGAQVLDRGEKHEYGAFGYVVDPDGTLLELWQPA
jgi:predicted enzyme related to lactoylglutathione lyase